MARAAAAAARAEAAPAHAPARRSSPPSRRRSGPATEPARRAPARPPSRGTRTAPAPARRGVTPALARFVEARTSGLLDRLLRGRLWVGCIGALLAGIVFLNVSLLQLNQAIARTSTHAAALDRQNSELRARLASLDSSERIQRLAQARGMLMPAPGQYRYLSARPWLDAELAARRATSPRSVASAAPPVAQPTPTTIAPTSTSTAGTSTGTTGTTSGQTTGTPVAAAPAATSPQTTPPGP